MIPLRLCSELLYQLDNAGEQQRLSHALTTIPVFLALYWGETQYEVLQLWAKLGQEHDIVEGYRRGLEAWRSRPQRRDDRATEDPGIDGAASNELECYERVAVLFERVSRWESAAELYAEMTTLAEGEENRARRGAAHRGLGGLRWMQGRYDEAMKELTIAQRIFNELGDRWGLSQAIGNTGLVYFARGAYQHALECYDRQETICREVGNLHGLLSAIGNRGNVYYAREEYDQALECYRASEAICRDLGDRNEMAKGIGNIGLVHSSLGDYHRALECYDQQQSICRDLGDRGGLSQAIGNMGLVYHARGEHHRALECYDQQGTICRDLGDRSGLSRAIGNRGSVYRDLGEYERALECYSLAIAELRAMGYLHILTYWVAGTAAVLLDLVATPAAPGDSQSMPEYLRSYLPNAAETTWRGMAVEHARRNAEECVTVSKQFAKRDTLFNGGLLLARVESAEGGGDLALQRLQTMFEGATDEQCADIYYWLWKLGDPKHRAEERAEALRLYRLLNANTPKHYYHKQIGELGGKV